MKKRWIGILPLLVFGLTACGANADTASMNEVPTIQTQEESLTEEVSVNAVSDGTVAMTDETWQETLPVTIQMQVKTKDYTAEDGTVILSDSFSYPVIAIEGKEELSKKINDDLFKQLDVHESTISEYVEWAKTDYQASLSDSAMVFQAYGTESKITLERKDENVLSFTEFLWSYTGGAHGNYTTTGINYSVKTGERLTFEDLSKDPDVFRTDILASLEAMAQTGSYKERLFEDYKDYMADTLLAPDKWYFSNSGITFISDPYALGSYAAGSINFVIPYEEIKGLKEEFAYNGNYEREAATGVELIKDINGDGSDETINYTTSYNEDYSESIASLSVNGVDFSSQISMENPESERYYLIDLDSSDPYIEIAIADYGPSDDPATYFYRYLTDGTLFCLGSVSDMLSSSDCYLESNNVLVGSHRLGILQTWFSVAKWSIQDGKQLSMVEQPMYYPTTQNPEPSPILRNVMVYMDMDLNAQAKELKPEDGPVEFTATDDKEWVEFTIGDGSKYYIYMPDGINIKSGEETLEAMAVFDKLIIAD